MRRVRAGARRPGRVAEAVRFAHVFLFAAAVPLLMRLRLPWASALLERVRGPVTPDAEAVPRIVHRVHAAVRLGYPLVRRGCLTRGVTLLYFLRRAGHDVELVFGMGRPAGDVLGHCWLVRDGLPFLERDDPLATYVEMYRIPRPDRRRAGARAPAPGGAS